MNRFEQLDVLREYMSDSKILDELCKAMSDDDFDDLFKYICRMYEIKVEDDRYDIEEDFCESFTESLNTEELSNIFNALSKIYEDEDKAAEVLKVVEEDSVDEDDESMVKLPEYEDDLDGMNENLVEAVADPEEEDIPDDFEGIVDYLKADEEEAISGYEKAIDKIEDEFVKDQLDKIATEEEAHKDYLDKVVDDPTVEYTEPLETEDDIPLDENLTEGTDEVIDCYVKLVNLSKSEFHPNEDFSLIDLKQLFKGCPETMKHYTEKKINLITKFDNCCKVIQETEKAFLISVPCYYRDSKDRTKILDKPEYIKVWAPKVFTEPVKCEVTTAATSAKDEKPLKDEVVIADATDTLLNNLEDKEAVEPVSESDYFNAF